MKCPIKYCAWDIDTKNEDLTLRHFLYHHTNRQLIDHILENKNKKNKKLR